MEKGFCRIATQNPNKDNIPSFEFNGLEAIAQTLFKSFNNDKTGD
jgi:hypothetical protein